MPKPPIVVERMPASNARQKRKKIARRITVGVAALAIAGLGLKTVIKGFEGRKALELKKTEAKRIETLKEINQAKFAPLHEFYESFEQADTLRLLKLQKTVNDSLPAGNKASIAGILFTLESHQANAKTITAIETKIDALKQIKKILEKQLIEAKRKGSFADSTQTARQLELFNKEIYRNIGIRKVLITVKNTPELLLLQSKIIATPGTRAEIDSLLGPRQEIEIGK